MNRENQIQKKVLVSAAVLLLILGFSPLALGQSVAGTEWTQDGSADSKGGLRTFSFKSNGTLLVSDDWSDDPGTWKQDGNSITISYGPVTMGRNTVVATIRATRKGNKMTGTLTWVLDGKTRPWSARPRT